MDYLAFDSTRYKTGGKYTIRSADKDFKIMAIGVRADSRKEAVEKFNRTLNDNERG